MTLPKIYRFDINRLVHVKVSRAKIALIWLLTLLVGFAVGFTFYLLRPERVKDFEYEELVVLIDGAESERMSPRALYLYMKEVGIKYPEIVWSQVALESRFCSKVCRENRNFFGMKRATCRPNVQLGENLGHAVYRNWKMSVLDYALWQASVGAHRFKSEADYFNYLDQRYAEDPNYGTKVKSIRDNFENNLNGYEERFKKGELK